MCVLVVDEDPAVTRLLKIMIESDGVSVVEANEEQALAVIPTAKPDLIVLGVSASEPATTRFVEKTRHLGYYFSVLSLSKTANRIPLLDPDFIVSAVRQLLPRSSCQAV
jgi:CheY-like chemotaxis protein